LKTFIDRIVGRIFNIELKGTAVCNRRTGKHDRIDKTEVRFKFELPLFIFGMEVKYTLHDRGRISKEFFLMNYENNAIRSVTQYEDIRNGREDKNDAST